MRPGAQLAGLGWSGGLRVVDHAQRREVVAERVLEGVLRQPGREREDAPQVGGEVAEGLEVRLVRLAQALRLAGPVVARPAGAGVEHLLEVARRALAAAGGQRLGGER